MDELTPEDLHLSLPTWEAVGLEPPSPWAMRAQRLVDEIVAELQRLQDEERA